MDVFSQIKRKLRIDFPLLAIDSSSDEPIYYHVLTPKAPVYHFKDQKRRDKVYDFRAEIVCKFYHKKNVLFETPAIDKFILSVPFYTLWTFPVSFYAQAKFLCEVDPNLVQSDRIILEEFLNRPILCYTKKGSDLTNQQPIQLVQYLARTPDEHNFFKNVHSSFQSAVDVLITKVPFEDFLLQYNHISKRTLYNVLDLRTLFNNSSMFTYEYTRQEIDTQLQGRGHKMVYSQGNTTAGQWGAFRTQIVRLQVSRRGEETGTDPETVFKSINQLWSELIGRETFPLSLAEFPFRLTAFDIEVGYSKEFTEDEECMATLAFPNIFTSYCQCICARSWIYRHGVEGAIVNYHFVLCPRDITTPQEILSKLSERTTTKMFWFKESVFVVFESEVDLIRQFLHMALTKSDVILGYNSSRFDIPYLIMRYNFLINPQKVLVSPLHYYPLVDYGYRIALKIQMKSIKLYCKNVPRGSESPCLTLNDIKDMHIDHSNGIVDCVSCLNPIPVRKENYHCRYIFLLNINSTYSFMLKRFAQIYTGS